MNIRRRKEGRPVQDAFKAVKAMWLTEKATTNSQETVPDDEEDEKNGLTCNLTQKIHTQVFFFAIFFSKNYIEGYKIF